MPLIEPEGDYAESWRIGGAAVTPLAADGRLVPLRLRCQLDGGPDTFDFLEGPGANAAPGVALWQEVSLTLDVGGPDEVVAFRGKVVGVGSEHSDAGQIHVYRCLGRQADALRVPLDNPAVVGTGYTLNMRRGDPGYSASLAGLSVGQIAWKLLSDHSAALSARGIGLATGLQAALEALDWVPSTGPVDVGGDRLWNAAVGLLARWAPNHRLAIGYTATGAEVNLANLSNVSGPVTLTHGVDPFDLAGRTIDLADTCSRVLAVGAADVEPRECSLLNGEAVEDWTSAEEDAWTRADFDAAGLAVDSGTIPSMTALSVTVDPSSATRAWPANFWGGTRRGRLRVRMTPISLPGQELETQQTRWVASNSALVAGGTATIGVDREFTLNTFTHYTLYGIKTDAERAHVGRRFKLATWLQHRLVDLFPHDEAYRFQGSAFLTRAPMAFGVVDGIRYQLIIEEIDAAAGTITLADPTWIHPALGNSDETLAEAGGEKTSFDDVVLFLPIAARPLRAAWPADSGGVAQHGGRGYVEFGVEETLQVNLPEWRDGNAAAAVGRWARELWDAVKAPHVRVALRWHGPGGAKWLPVRGRGVQLAARVGPGGPSIGLGALASSALPLRAVEVNWNAAGSAASVTVGLLLDNGQRPLRGQAPDPAELSGEALTGTIWDHPER